MNKSIIAALLAAAFAVGCGGGSHVEDAPTEVVAGTETGILTDGPVGGVEYTTSGGYSGVTAEDGSYSYNEGETVTFKIGAITLGTVTATGTVTPLELAAAAGNAENVATNLLVLLQSLDADGDASNGITINAATKAAAANASTIDLTADPATFASASNGALTAVMNSASLPKTAPVSEADALAHFKSEFFKNLAGNWVYATDEGVVVVRFGDTGRYILGEVGMPDGSGHSGTEVGQIDWNPKTGKFHQVEDGIVHDSNGDWGLDQANGSEVVKVDANRLTIIDEDGTVTTLVRVKNDPASIVGVWALDSATAMNTQTFTFFDSGKYMMADPVGDDEAAGTPCSTGGIEWGTYTFDSATNVLAVTAPPKVDTNDCAGLWDEPGNSGGEAELTFNDDKSEADIGGRTLYRVSK